MKKVIWEIGIGLMITGGLGMVIDFFANRIPSPEFWILLVSFCVGVISMVVSHYWEGIASFCKCQCAKYQFRRQLRRIVQSRRFMHIHNVDDIPLIQEFEHDTVTTIRIEKKVKLQAGHINWSRDMEREPERFIFPYVQLVNISPLITGQCYVHIMGAFPSALPYHFTLHDVSTQLVMKARTMPQPTIIESDRQPIKNGTKVQQTYTFCAENSNGLSNFYICLGKEDIGKVLRFFHENEAVEVTLEIYGTDDKGKQHRLSTETIPLALLNGDKLSQSGGKQQ